MAYSSTITQTDGTVRATTWVGLLYNLTMYLHNLQGRYNRAKPKFKRNDVQIDKKYDGEVTSLTAKITLQGQRIVAENSLVPNLKLDSEYSQYIVDENGQPVPFDGGTGVLAGITTIEEAIKLAAEMVSFLESQIEPDQLIKEVNIVNSTPAPEDGVITFDISIPLRNSWDIATGTPNESPKNYLYLLDVETEAI